MSKEDLSTSLDPHSQLLNQFNYIECIQELKTENRYKKQALITAQNLIESYRNENQLLKKQNLKLIEETEKYQKQMQQVREEFERKIQIKDKNVEMSARFELLVDRQQKYEQKIRDMENKILILERKNKNINNLKSKFPLKTQYIAGNYQCLDKREQLDSHRKPRDNYKKLAELRNMYLYQEKQTQSLKKIKISADDRLDSLRKSYQKNKNSRFSTPKKRMKPSKVSWR